MKKVLGVLFMLCSLYGCSIFDEPDTEIEKLPALTQTGRGNFGCLINGKAVRVTNSLLMRAIKRQDVFVIRFSNTVDNKLWTEKLRQFEFTLTAPIEIGVTYDLTDTVAYNIQYVDYENDTPNCTYESGSTLSGTLTFSNIDRTNYILSGTFEFETVTQNCNTIRATEGRFDLHYEPL